MKKIFLFFILSGILFSCEKKVDIRTKEIEDNQSNSTDNISEQNPSDELPLITVTKSNELIITVRYDYEPYMWLDNNEFKGYLVDVEKAIMNRMGQKYSMVEFTNAEKAVMEFKDGKLHAAVGTPITPDFQQIVNFSDSYITLDLVTLVQSGNNEIGGKTKDDVINSLLDKYVGVQARGIEYNFLREYREINIVEYETGTVALEKLAAGEVDAKIENKEIALYYARKNGWDIKPVGVPLISMTMAMGFSKRVDPEIIERYNTALRSIINDGTYDRIYNSWFSE